MFNKSQPFKKDKIIVDERVGSLPKVLKAYMDEAILSTDPARSIFGYYASGCCDVILTTWWSIQKWNSMDGNPHLTTG